MTAVGWLFGSPRPAAPILAAAVEDALADVPRVPLQPRHQDHLDTMGRCVCGEPVFQWAPPFCSAARDVSPVRTNEVGEYASAKDCRGAIAAAHTPSGLPVPPAEWCMGPEMTGYGFPLPLPEGHPESLLVPLPEDWQPRYMTKPARGIEAQRLSAADDEAWTVPASVLREPGTWRQ